MENNPARVTVVDVGHGNATVIQENGTTVVIDTGLKGRLKEYLLHQNISVIDLVILSHSDQDHIGGLVGILASNFEVKQVKLNADADKDSEEWIDLIFTLAHPKYKGKIQWQVGLTEGLLTVPGFASAKLEVVAPTNLLAAFGVGGKDRNKKIITSNSLSAVVRVLYQDKSVVLITGDMDEITLNEIQENGIAIEAKHLIFPHHGGLSGKDPKGFAIKLLQLVKPESVLFSLGRAKHENPRPEIIDATISVSKDIYIACTQLSKRCAEDYSAVPRPDLTSVFSHGAREGICCAGTIEINLASATISRPNIGHHQEFINDHVPTPLCRSARMTSVPIHIVKH